MKANVFVAINLAADQIERCPDSYRFMNSYIPTHPRTDVCLLGWIGHFMGEQGCIEVVADKLGLPNQQYFYDRMRSLGVWPSLDKPRHLAKALRKYARKYHVREAPIVAKRSWLSRLTLQKQVAPTYAGIPASVREIFTTKEVA